jgi:class 3 adenylate cyclase
MEAERRQVTVLFTDVVGLPRWVVSRVFRSAPERPARSSRWKSDAMKE